MPDTFRCDPAVIQAHPKLCNYFGNLQNIADIIQQESVVRPNSDERSYWGDKDTLANNSLRVNGVMALFGDPIMKTLAPGGKEVDIFVGAIKGVGIRCILAVECKLKVGYGTCASEDFYRDLEAKFDQVKSALGQYPIQIHPKMFVLMCRRNSAVCRKNLNSFRMQHRGLQTFTCLECKSISDLSDVLI